MVSVIQFIHPPSPRFPSAQVIQAAVRTTRTPSHIGHEIHIQSQHSKHTTKPTCSSAVDHCSTCLDDAAHANAAADEHLPSLLPPPRAARPQRSSQPRRPRRIRHPLQPATRSATADSTRCQHTVIGHQVPPRSRHQCQQPLDQHLRLHDHVRRAVGAATAPGKDK